jgi:hypothetical protein
MSVTDQPSDLALAHADELVTAAVTEAAEPSLPVAAGQDLYLPMPQSFDSSSRSAPTARPRSRQRSACSARQGSTRASPATSLCVTRSTRTRTG